MERQWVLCGFRLRRRFCWRCLHAFWYRSLDQSGGLFTVQINAPVLEQDQTRILGLSHTHFNPAKLLFILSRAYMVAEILPREMAHSSVDASQCSKWLRAHVKLYAMWKRVAVDRLHGRMP
jgi:hypothetical protein